MVTARFAKDGGNLVVNVTCTPARDGSYRLKLWEANENKIVKEWEGNFINTDDDEYKLPKPNHQHDGRLLECLLVVSVPGGVGPATVALVVSQDGTELDRHSQTIPPGSAGALADLFVQLKEA